MNVPEVVLAIIASLLGVASAMFSAVETAVFSMSESRRRRLRAADPTCATRVDALFDRPGEVGNALMLADTLVTLPLIVLLLFLQGMMGIVDDLPGWAVATGLFFVVIVVCDLLPKLLGLTVPVRISRMGIPVAWRVVSALDPVCRWIHAICERVVRGLVPRRIAPVPHLTDEELETLVEIGRDEGTLNDDECQILRAVLRLEGKPAKHCMTPRVDAFFISDDLTNDEAAALIRLKRLRRVPVRGQKTDDVEGILDAKAFLLDPLKPYTEQLQVPSFVPETMKALDLLRSFLHHRQHLALLLDEYGGVEGVVTLSDIVEELLGGEGPDPARELYIERLAPDRILASGGARLDDVEDALGCSFDADGIDSVGGLVIDRLGMLPRPGARVQIGGWTVSVRRATRKRIKEVMIEPTALLARAAGAVPVDSSHREPEAAE